VPKKPSQPSQPSQPESRAPTTRRPGGKPKKLTKRRIRAASLKHEGKASAMATDLGVHLGTLYRAADRFGVELKRRVWKRQKKRVFAGKARESTPRAVGPTWKKKRGGKRGGEREDRWYLGKRYQAVPGSFHPSEYEVVANLDRDVTKGFVLTHHYSQTYPKSAYIGPNYGLYHKPSNQLVGVAAYGSPGGAGVIPSWFGHLEDLAKVQWDPHKGEWYAAPLPASKTGIELQRMVLLDAVPYGSEAWFIRKTFNHLGGERGIEGVVSFSDPWYGHVGTVYKAASGYYTGMSRAGPVWRYKDTGFQIPRRIITKLQAADKVWAGCHGSAKSIGGWQSDIRTLQSHGAPAPIPGGCLRTWLDTILPMIADRVAHPGKHRYLWGLTKRAKSAFEEMLVDPRTYPVVCDQCGTLFYTDELDAMDRHARECVGSGITNVRALIEYRKRLGAASNPHNPYGYWDRNPYWRDDVDYYPCY
jgi:hypothetical protein